MSDFWLWASLAAVCGLVVSELLARRRTMAALAFMQLQIALLKLRDNNRTRL